MSVGTVISHVSGIARTVINHGGDFLVSQWKLVGGSLVVLIVVVLVTEHVRDSHRDQELLQLHAVIARDSAQRLATIARTDSVLAAAALATQVTAHAVTGWRGAARQADAVPAIVASAVPDTVKIRELVTIVDTLRLRGDSLERAAVADTVALVQLRVAFTAERSAWSVERTDLKQALDVSEARHRHWGFGVTIGPSAVRDPAGVVRAGPIGATIGLTYRW